jgi:lipid-binding SYLF domain-containing protein
MFIQRSFLSLTALSIFAAGAAHAQDEAAERRAELDANANETLQRMYSSIEGSKALFDEAAGYAVFSATKAGFGISGGGGSGVAVDKGAGETVYMKMAMGGVGFTYGAEQYDVVMLFQSADRLKAFIDGGWDAGAAAEASAGGNSAAVGAAFIDGAAVFTLTGTGAMASASVSGTRFWVDEDLN